MKKWLSLIVIGSLFLFSSTAMAHGDKGKHEAKGQGKNVKECLEIPPGLLKALEKGKNEKAKAAIKANIEKYKEKCKEDKDEENQGLTDVQRVSGDKAALQIHFADGNRADWVTGAIQLPVKGNNGSDITWSSNKPNIISNNGLTVNRPQSADETVVMTAVLRYNQTTASKTFTLIVKAVPASMTDAQKAAADLAALQIKFNGTDTADRVTQPLKMLLTSSSNGSSITWFSGAPTIISNDGKTVNRPAPGSGDAIVIMTAYAVNNTAVATKTFQLTVKQQLTDIQKVANDKAALEIDFGGSDTSSRVTRPIDQLPTAGTNGSVIFWSSSAPGILSADGKTINRPAVTAGDITVALTANITSNGVTDFKVFYLTVKREFTSAEKVAADKADLNITFADKDSAASVTKPIGLPATGYYGSTITWYSTLPSVISNNGTVVNRPARGTGDITVTMMGYISNNGAVDIKIFTLTVKQLP
jgi:uncharacterized membrane protein